MQTVTPSSRRHAGATAIALLAASSPTTSLAHLAGDAHAHPHVTGFVDASPVTLLVAGAGVLALLLIVLLRRQSKQR